MIGARKIKRAKVCHFVSAKYFSTITKTNGGVEWNT